VTGVTRTHVLIRSIFSDGYTSDVVGTSVKQFVWSDAYDPYLILSAVGSSPPPKIFPPHSQLNEILSARSAVRRLKLILQVSRPPVIFPTQRFGDDLSSIHKPNQILRLFFNYYVTMPQQSKL